eukprot:7386725-Prymnesium_polylepis.1
MLLLPKGGLWRASLWSCRRTVTRAATGRTTFAVACASESTRHLDPALPASRPARQLRPRAHRA